MLVVNIPIDVSYSDSRSAGSLNQAFVARFDRGSGYMETGQPNASAPESAEGKSTHRELNRKSQRDNQHVEVALRHSQAHLNSILNSAMDAIITVDEKHRILFFNHAAERMFLCSADKAIGQPLERFIPERFRASHTEHIKDFGETDVATRAMASTRAVSGLRANGEEFPVEASISQAEVEGEKLFTVILRDITERVRAEKRFHQVIEHTPNGVVMVNKEGIIMLANAQIEKTFGYDRRELLGQPIDKLIPQRFHKHHANYVNNFISSPSARPMGAGRDLFGLRKDGTEFPVEIGLNPIETEQGVMVLGTIVDITERKTAEEGLRESEKRFRELAESLPQLVWTCRAEDGYCDYLSPQWVNYTGIPESEQLGFAWLEQLHPDDRNPTITTWNRAVEVETIFDVEFRIRRYDGIYRWFQTRAVPLKDNYGKIVKWLGTNTDIEDRKRAEEALSRNRAQLEAVFQSIQDGVVMTDMYGNLLLVNEAEAHITGFPSADAMKKSLDFFVDIFELAYPDGRLLPVEEWPISKILKGQSVKDLELRAKRLDTGQEWFFSFNGEPVYNEQGKQIFAVVSTRDITEQKEAEEMILRMNEELEQRVRERTAQLEVSNKELESFSYSVSHDLRAPLRHINGFSQALLEDYGDRLDEEGRRYLREVRDASKEMANLIDDMLQLARITRSEMNKDLVNLSKLVNEILSQLQAREPERDARVNIEDGLLAYGDQRLLGVMMNNLLGNAWKFTSKKDVSSISFGRKQRRGQTIYYVHDNGSGFDMKYSDKLFGVFQRLHRTDEFEGTGVGLAIVQRIVRRHGGQVWAESVLNEGATFYFTLSQSQGSINK